MSDLSAAGKETTVEELYLAAHDEVVSDDCDREILGQALAEADGNIQEAQNIYIRIRVAQFSKADDVIDC